MNTIVVLEGYVVMAKTAKVIQFLAQPTFYLLILAIFLSISYISRICTDKERLKLMSYETNSCDPQNLSANYHLSMSNH